MSLASTAAVDRLVLQYLKRRRLHEAGKVLSLELRASCAPEDVEMQAWSEVNDGDDDGALLEALALDGSEPAAYARAYTAFAAWVDASLDLYKPELACLLYPVLVHVSLSLVERGAASEAHALLAEHGPRFAAAGSGPAAEHRARELQSLQTLTGREQLAGNAAAAAWRARRAGVRLSAYSHGLLLRALQTPALQLILGVVNGHVRLEVAEGPPAGAAELAAAEELGAGRAGEEDGAAHNRGPIDLQLLQGSVEDAWAQAKFDRLEREAAAEADAGAGSADGATKKQRAALAKAAADAKAQRESVAANRMACEIPLPPRTEEESAALASELDGRVAVSPSALPSALLCTFVNTHASLAAAAVALDARCVAGGFADGSVRLHDLGQGGAAAAVLRGHEAGVHGVALSPDASLALSCSADGSVRLWSRALGAGLVAWRGAGPGASPVWDVAWCPASPAGHYFATGGADRALRVWSVERARALRLCAGAGADVDAEAWHPNAHVVAGGGGDRAARLWDVRSAAPLRTLGGHRGAATALAFSHDGRCLAVGDAAGEVAVWDLAAARRRAVLRGPARPDPVWSLAWSRGGEGGGVLAAGSADACVRLWDGGAEGGAGRPGDPGPAPLAAWRTKATPVLALEFSHRNLLLGAGALALYRPRKV
ncbi:hypothetical protein ACKKBG_A03140 [Auxenochlorella protothecoides x Auxenochlorella symbiontica]